jgi:hypothetical protein
VLSGAVQVLGQLPVDVGGGPTGIDTTVATLRVE